MHTHPSTDVVDSVVFEWEVDALWLEPASRDYSVDDVVVRHPISLVVNNEGIQKWSLHYLLHSGRPAVVRQPKHGSNGTLWRVTESVSVPL